MPFVVDPPFSKRAKAFWVLGITVLTSSEIISMKLADDDSKAKFEALLTRFDETLNTMTGGKSWPYIELVEIPLENRQPLHVPRLSVRGRHPSRGLRLRVIDYRKVRQACPLASELTAFNYWSNQFSTMVTLGDERAGALGWYL